MILFMGLIKVIGSNFGSMLIGDANKILYMEEQEMIQYRVVLVTILDGEGGIDAISY